MRYVPAAVQELEIPSGDREAVRFCQIREAVECNFRNSTPCSSSVVCVRAKSAVASAPEIEPRGRRFSNTMGAPLVKTQAFSWPMAVKVALVHKNLRET